MTTQKTYSELLQDPRWQKKKAEIQQLYGFKCCRCGETTKTFHVHHRFYVRGRMPWEYNSSELELLCCDCHRAEHDPTFKRTPKPVADFIPGQYPGIIEKQDPAVVISINRQIDELNKKLSDPITPFELQEEILRNIVFLQKQRKELLNG